MGFELKHIHILIAYLSIFALILYPVCIIVNIPNADSVVVEEVVIVTTDDSYVSDLQRESDWIAPIHYIEKVQEEAHHKPKYSITEDERIMVATLVYLEAGDQNKDCQLAVCSVVFNRWRMGWGGARTLHDVVYARKQFSPAHRIPYTRPSQMQLDVVDYICANGVVDEEIVFFYYKKYSKYGVPCYNIGTEYFSKAG